MKKLLMTSVLLFGVTTFVFANNKVTNNSEVTKENVLKTEKTIQYEPKSEKIVISIKSKIMISDLELCIMISNMAPPPAGPSIMQCLMAYGGI
ncbi:hypothetical protein QGN23_10170 [Chryseobacterium gotjawalense]|uniref:Uncharacterized protein n=1 Tax=Chryseobacterium gotjawalense TaxID=3042315 RepID=A0ABY8RCK2_9FLAO|nr:hypothetical protein [Chryseobacterium sp. wdc7]WHF50797.1 hypothetical protein QGN23_10170 [Chryseobacterium sp. wdc7]